VFDYLFFKSHLETLGYHHHLTFLFPCLHGLDDSANMLLSYDHNNNNIYTSDFMMGLFKFKVLKFTIII